MARQPLDLNEGTLDPETDDSLPRELVGEPLPPAPPPAVTPQLTLSMSDLQALVGTAVQAALQTSAANQSGVAAAITQGLKEAREPLPENKTSDGVSQLNPYGDLAHPRPGLRCEMWRAVIDAQNQIVPWYEILADDLSAREQCALNVLQPADTRIAMLGSDVPDMRVTITARRNEATGAIERLLIGVPLKHVMQGSDTKNFVPDIVSTVRQVTGHDFRSESLSDDELQWVMAEHCAKRYVPPRAKREAAA